MRKLIAGLTLLLGMNCLAATTYTHTDGNLRWSFTLSGNPATATLTAVQAVSGDLTGAITTPATVKKDGVEGDTTYPVTAIAANSFQSLAITGLTIADSVKTIGAGAFANCMELVSVDMGNEVETIDSANYRALTYADEQQFVAGTFGNCILLETVKFSPVLRVLGGYAFSGCDALRTVELPDSLETIGVNCFFKNESLVSVEFETGLLSIGAASFYGCPELQSVKFDASETPLLTIGEDAFAQAVKLVTLEFSNSLKQIDKGAFAGCQALETLDLPDSLKTMGSGVFADCKSLKTLDMGSGVETIDSANYRALTYADEQQFVAGTFGNCILLETVKFSSRLAELGAYAFSGCLSLETVTLPESLVTIKHNCFFQNKSLTSVSFGKRIETIGENSFYGCPALRYVTFAETTTPLLAIEPGAFANDISLTTVTLSGGLKSVASGAFANDPLLRKLTIPSIVTEIGSGVFSGMGNLKQVTFTGLPPTGIENAGLAKDVEIRYSEEWAEDWAPIIETCGFTNTTSYDPSVKPPVDPVITGDVKLMVSNIVVHYVTQSIPSDAVIPPTSAGIVNVVTEVNAGNAIAITADWAKQYPGFEDLYGEDFGKAVTAQTGKRDGAGNPMFVWQDFVAGTDPTKPEDTFKASITFDKDTGKPVISWTPELSGAEAAKREYKVFGKAKINDKDWTLVDGDAEDFNFFKVSVGMKP